MAKDFYLVLQVGRKASPDEIRSAYRRRAMELHPDTSGADSEPFLELQRAYSVLSDASRRADYDRRRGRAPRRASSRKLSTVAADHLNIPGVLRDISCTSSFETYAPSFEEVSERLWGNFVKPERPKGEHIESLTVDVPLSPWEAADGGTVRILVPARLACAACAGAGRIGLYECWRCRGEGAISANCPIELSYPAGIRRTQVAQVSLADLGIHNLYLNVRFRPTQSV